MSSFLRNSSSLCYLFSSASLFSLLMNQSVISSYQPVCCLFSTVYHFSSASLFFFSSVYLFSSASVLSLLISLISLLFGQSDFFSHQPVYYLISLASVLSLRISLSLLIGQCVISSHQSVISSHRQSVFSSHQPVCYLSSLASLFSLLISQSFISSYQPVCYLLSTSLLSLIIS